MHIAPVARRACSGARRCLAAGACTRTPIVTAPAPRRRPRARRSYATGEAVVAAMHDRYAGTLVPHASPSGRRRRACSPNGTWDVQTWYEALELPGRLRIDFDPVSGGQRRALRARQPVRRRQRPPRARGAGNQRPPPARLRRLRATRWRAPTRCCAGRASTSRACTRTRSTGGGCSSSARSAGETRRKQFWVDAERLLFVRLLEPDPRDSTRVQDIRFVNYQPRGDAWISARAWRSTPAASSSSPRTTRTSARTCRSTSPSSIRRRGATRRTG